MNTILWIPSYDSWSPPADHWPSLAIRTFLNEKAHLKSYIHLIIIYPYYHVLSCEQTVTKFVSRIQLRWKEVRDEDRWGIESWLFIGSACNQKLGIENSEYLDFQISNSKNEARKYSWTSFLARGFDWKSPTKKPRLEEDRMSVHSRWILMDR